VLYFLATPIAPSLRREIWRGIVKRKYQLPLLLQKLAEHVPHVEDAVPHTPGMDFLYELIFQKSLS
jgi:hypothetical protein